MKLRKKAQLSAILSAPFETIGHFISTMPPMAKAMMFLIFLGLLGTIISFMFGMFGYHCDADDNLYKVSILRIDQNIALLTEKPGTDDLSSTSFDTGSRSQNVGSQCIIQDTNGTRYLNAVYCTDCPNTTYITATTDQFRSVEVCQGDVTRLDENQKGWWQRILCTDDVSGLYPRANCDIPTNYYYNQTIGKYSCDNLEICGNITQALQWKTTLQEKGTLIEQNTNIAKNYNQAFDISCDNLKPDFRFYSIPILDYRIWMFLTVISVMLFILFKIKGSN